jgi:serine/threonine protein kinase
MTALVEGQMFERYRINRWLGSGIAGETYEAEDTAVLRKVAFKLLHPWGTLPDAARRQFYREMEGISQLHYQYLAPILDYGEYGGKIYVARRFASTGSLLSSEGRMWFKPPLPVSDAFHYTHQLAQALHALHARGYMHGSLTLSNILILRGFNAEQEVNFAPFLLSDAGMANFVRRYGEPQNALLPITAAPEQFNKRATPASDQFALAVLLYFWLAGRPPYLGSTEEITEQKLTGQFAPLASLNHDIVPSQEAILRRALAVSPTERFPSILAFANALLTTLAETAPMAKLAASRGGGSAPPANSNSASPANNDFAPPANSDSAPPAPAETPTTFELIPQTEPALVKEEAPAYPAGQMDETAPEATAADTLAEPAMTPHFAAIPDTEPVTALATTDAPMATNDDEPAIAETTPPSAPLPPRLAISSLTETEPYEVVLEAQEYMLGRAGSDTIFLADGSVSRHHALLHYADGCYILSDNRSAAGVYVNGKALNEQEARALADGDQITMGNYALIFRQG